MANRNGWCTFALVAVQHSERFWERWGFGPRHKFEYTSGINATYMIRKGRPQWK
jgi:hypothetical protein